MKIIPIIIMFVSSIFSYHIANVKNYGAEGDGVTNDSSAICDALESVIDSGGGVLYFPPGNYYNTKTIVLNGAVPIKVCGDSEYLSSLIGDSVTTVMISLEGDTQNVRYKEICNLGIKRCANGINEYFSLYNKIHDIQFYKMVVAGIKTSGNTGLSSIYRCRFLYGDVREHDNEDSLTCGVLVLGSNSLTISDCDFGEKLSIAIRTQQLPSVEHSLSIVNNRFHDGIIKIYNVAQAPVLILNNTFGYRSTNIEYCIKIKRSCGVIVSNNIIQSANKGVIVEDISWYNNFNNNVFKYCNIAIIEIHGPSCGQNSFRSNVCINVDTTLVIQDCTDTLKEMSYSNNRPPIE